MKWESIKECVITQSSNVRYFCNHREEIARCGLVKIGLERSLHCFVLVRYGMSRRASTPTQVFARIGMRGAVTLLSDN